jgi:Cu2+-containing amine oxidase
MPARPLDLVTEAEYLVGRAAFATQHLWVTGYDPAPDVPASHGHES